ncbi:MAG: hypothetical protein ACD_5C00061G0001, partial [uncultured bacterium]
MRTLLFKTITQSTSAFAFPMQVAGQEGFEPPTR